MSHRDFKQLLARAAEDHDSLVCVGLDPEPEKFPPHLRGVAHSIFEFNKAIVDATADLVCSYKPQFAHYAALGAEDQLLQTIRYINARAPGVPVILDSKRGDIGNTAGKYAQEAFERYGADAVTVNPYLGGDSLQPFLDWKDKGIVILCRTSNPGARDFQDLEVGGGRKLYHLLTPRMAELQVAMGRDQFFDLLRQERLLIRRRNRRVRTTMSKHGMPVYPDLLKGLPIKAPGQVWVSDITYWRVQEGFYFIFLITDACSHKIIGYHVARSMDAEHAMIALRMAQRATRHRLKGIIHHSDRGGQYCFTQYVNLLQENGMRISMTQGGDPRDNAIAERVNGILKNELLAHHDVENIIQARSYLQVAIEAYNLRRPHLSCDMRTPEQAHGLDHVLQRRWRTYPYRVNRMQDKQQVVNPTQD